MHSVGRQEQNHHRRERREHHDLEDTMSDRSGKTTIVVGASRGFGRGIAMAFAEAGARVVAVSRKLRRFQSR